MKYLVIQNQYYVDGHGECEEGDTTKFITDKNYWCLFKNDGETYYNELNPGSWDFKGFEKATQSLSSKALKKFIKDEYWVEEPESSDGYNSTVYNYTVKEITDEQAIEYQNIIDNYNKL